MPTIGRATIASPGQPKPAPGLHVERLYRTLHDVRGHFVRPEDDARALLSSIAQWLTQDWAENSDRGENFQASLTILECLEELQ